MQLYGVKAIFRLSYIQGTPGFSIYNMLFKTSIADLEATQSHFKIYDAKHFIYITVIADWMQPIFVSDYFFKNESMLLQKGENNNVLKTLGVESNSNPML